jgi:adenylate kinase family enzyme
MMLRFVRERLHIRSDAISPIRAEARCAPSTDWGEHRAAAAAHGSRWVARSDREDARVGAIEEWGHQILVKGTSGAGKSTLARELARRCGVRHVELDALHHGPGWKAATASELCAAVEAALDGEHGWVVDGNYDDKLGELVLARATLIVWLDLPLGTKLARLARRTLRRQLRREALWNGNRENLKSAFWGFDALFAWAVRTHFRQRRQWPSLFEGRPVVRLRTAPEVARWLAAFTTSEEGGPHRASEG